MPWDASWRKKKVYVVRDFISEGTAEYVFTSQGYIQDPVEARIHTIQFLIWTKSGLFPIHIIVEGNVLFACIINVCRVKWEPRLKLALRSISSKEQLICDGRASNERKAVKWLLGDNKRELHEQTINWREEKKKLEQMQRISSAASMATLAHYWMIETDSA